MNNYNIKLNAVLDKTSLSNIDKDIKNVTNNKSVNLKSNFGDLDEQLKKLNIDMKNFKLLSTNTNGTDVTQKLIDGNGKMVTVQQKLIDGNNKYKVSLKEVNNSVKASSDSADVWKYSWTKAFQSFSTYMSVTTLFFTMIHGIADMVNEVEDLDSSLTELQKVTDLTGDSLKSFVSSAYDVGTTVAKTGTEMVDAATEFAKAGYGEDEILQLGKVAAMYTNIADEEVSTADAAGFVIAQMKAFNIQASDSEHIIDAVNEVSNDFAVSSADIANNLGKSSSVMANAGNSYEQTIGLLTAGTELTRDAAKVSNGLKTITLRLQGMDDEGTASLELQSQMEAMFNKLGLSVYKSNGELKNTYEIMKDLAPVYKSASTEEKSYITETIAGKFQAQNASAILNNFTTAINATATAMNSAGSAETENAKVMNSIKGHLANLSSEWEKFSKDMINSDFIKFFVDLGSTILKVTDSSFGTLTLKMISVIAVVKTFKKAIDMTKTSKGFIEIVTNFKALSSTLTTSFNDAGKGAKGLKSAIGTLASSIDPVTLSIIALASAVAIGSAVYDNYKKKIQEAASSGEELKSTNASIQSDADRVEAYRKTIDNVYSSNEDVASAKESLLSIQNDLIKSYGLESSSLDLVNGNLKDQLGLINDLTKKNAQNWINKNQSAINSAKDATSGFANNGILSPEIIKNYGIDAGKKNSFMSEWGQKNGYKINKVSDAISSDLVSSENDTKTIEYLNKLSEYMQKNKQEVLDAGLTEADYKDMLQDVGNEITKLTDKYSDYHKILDQYKEAVLGTADGYKDFNKEITDAGEKGSLTADDAQKIIDKYPSVADAMDKAGLSASDMATQYNKVSEAENTTSNSASTSVDSFSKIGTAIDDIQDKYSTLSSTISEYNDNGYLSIDTIQTLLAKGWDYLQYLDLQNGKLELNKQALLDAADAELDNAEATAYKNAIDSINSIMSGDQVAINGLLGTSYDNLKGKVSSYTDEYNNLIKSEEVQKALENGGDASKAIQNAEKLLNTQLDIIKKGKSNLSKSIESNSKSSSKDSKEWWETALDDLKNQFSYSEININEYISSLDKLLSKTEKGSEAWEKINEELQKQRLDKVKSDYDADRISLDEYISSLKDLLKAYKEGTDGWNNLASAIKKAELDALKKKQDDIKSALSAINDSIDKQIDSYNKLKDASDDAYDSQLDSLNKVKDKLTESSSDYESAKDAITDYLNKQLDALNIQKDTAEKYYDDIINAQEKSNEKISNAIELSEAYEKLMNAMTEKSKKVWREGIGWVWETDKTAISDAKKSYEDLLKTANTDELNKQKDDMSASYDKQIDALQKYINTWDDVLNKFSNEKNLNLANLLLGNNWQGLVVALDTSVVDKFADSYYNLQKQLSDTEKQISNMEDAKKVQDDYYDAKIKDLDSLKDKWSEVEKSYEETQDSLKAAEILGADWEASIFDQRIAKLEEFKNKYNGILKDIDVLNNASDDDVAKYSGSSLPGFKNGGEIDYTGLAMVHGSKSKPEYVFNNDQMKGLLKNLIRPDYSSKSEGKTNSAVNNYNFGNIELPNVTNSQQFVAELKTLVNLTKNQ